MRRAEPLAGLGAAVALLSMAGPRCYRLRGRAGVRLI